MARSAREEVMAIGIELLATIRGLLEEGNARRLVVESDAGRVFLDVPLTIGVVGAMALPWWSTLALLLGASQGCRVRIERVEGPSERRAEAPVDGEVVTH